MADIEANTTALTTAASSVDVVDFETVDDGTTWLGTVLGLNYS